MSEGIRIKPGDGKVQNHVRIFITNLISRDGFHGVVLRDGVFYKFVENVLGLQTFCSLSDDGPSGLCLLRTQHRVDVGLRSELEKFLPRLGDSVAVPLDEGSSVVVALVRHMVHLFAFYPQDAVLYFVIM